MKLVGQKDIAKNIFDIYTHKIEDSATVLRFKQIITDQTSEDINSMIFLL
jgi:hypothetical protein